jgi:Glyoxalase-like domain
MRVDATGARIDHIVFGVADLNEAALRFDNLYGLRAVEGGRHPGWGTANWLVPLGETYLELITVVDRSEAATNGFGRWVSAMLDGAPTLGWAVRTDNLNSTASRLGLEVVEGSRRARSGALLQWQIAGLAQAANDPALPFFIQWGPDTPLPGRAAVQHRAGTVALSGLRIEGDEKQLHTWIGAGSLPLDVRPGSRGLTHVILKTPTETIVITNDG